MRNLMHKRMHAKHTEGATDALQRKVKGHVLGANQTSGSKK